MSSEGTWLTYIPICYFMTSKLMFWMVNAQSAHYSIKKSIKSSRNVNPNIAGLCSQVKYTQIRYGVGCRLCCKGRCFGHLEGIMLMSMERIQKLRSFYCRQRPVARSFTKGLPKICYKPQALVREIPGTYFFWQLSSVSSQALLQRACMLPVECVRLLTFWSRNFTLKF